jgi:twitching motility two-component system response regulator PilG
MRLEFEQNHTHPGYAGDLSPEMAAEHRAAEAANCLREGIRAAQGGNRVAARAALLRTAELDPQSESAWLWLSSISEYPEELLAFLTNVLEINPRNARALEWSAATKSLLAKNFVQRGIDAADSNQNDIAAQHFNQALEYDEKNSMAWLWLASLCESNEGKLSYLEKVLEFEPENETAKAGYQAARNSIREGLLAEARTAAVTGDSQSANELLDAVIAEEPNAEDAWVLKSHIAVGFEEKITAFRRVLEINPENNVARAGLESLTAIMDSVAVKSPVVVEGVEFVPEPEAVSFDQPEPVQEFAEEESADDAGVVETVWAEAAPETSFEQTSEEHIAPSPFESYAEEPVVDFNGTMLMTTSDFGFALDGVVEVHEESAEAEFAVAEKSTYSPAEVPPAAEEMSFHFDAAEQVDEQPASVQEFEEITYELAPEAPNADNEPAEYVNGSDTEQSFPQVDQMEEEPAIYAAPEIADVAAISAPTGNPFEAEEFRNEPDAYQTVISVDLDAELQAAVQNYDPVGNNGSSSPKAFDVPFETARYSGTIPMPAGDLDQFVPSISTGFETRVIERSKEEPRTVSSAVSCPFCSTENDAQAIACHGCLAVLTLADLELILANHHADKVVLRQAVEEMERERASRELSEAELTTLGIGHLNLRNLQYGYNYLYEASQKNPNNVVLSGQANALLIRLEEIKQQTEVHEAMVKGKTILVVDDSPTVLKLIAGKLEKCGHDVFCCADGVEAMDRLSTLKPDLILLDITMPRMDGYQVCKLIRGDATTRDTPVIMISGKDGFFDKVRGRMAGASGYITKPFGPETLMKAVESYLNPEA